ncbi:ABC transporter substrate-binding protein [Hyperthermus butylicus]|uniref:ABC transporter n=1 Tax=Hyperthermus butylicus (strain DSM 5456 / JCM 9403 / PLM1-5) TaxID=415426 RepID=A2BMR6_HYPBU|nr:ABC transporter substrate-binding protein [Hyperthermus butylicus]ABM81277.1 putative ABC transporter [Hyperthermus butylicus DSM 5456]
MSRGAYIAVAVVVVAAALVAAVLVSWGGGGTQLSQPGQASTAAEQHCAAVETVRIGTLRGGVSTLDVIETLGLDEKHCLQIETLYFAKTLDLANALARGDIDVAVIPAEFVAKLREQGTDAVIIAVDFYQNQAIVVRPGVEAETIENLEGARLGVFKPTGTYAIFRAYMKAIYGIDVEEYFTLVDAPPPQLVQAFERGDVDAVVLWEPLVSKLVVEYGGRILVSYEQLWREWPGHVGDQGVMIVYAARGSWARENPELVEALQAARSEAAHAWNNNMSLAVDILAKGYGLSREAAEYCWQRLKMEESEALSKPMVENILAVWELARRGGYISSSPDQLAEGAFWQAG